MANRVIVRIRRGSSCGSCRAREACSALGENEEFAEVTAVDRLGVTEGDEVRLFLSDSVFLRLSLVVYLIPTLALLLGAVLGSRLYDKPGVDPNLVTIVSGLLFFGTALLLTSFWARRGSRNDSHLPKIIKILRPASSPGNPA